MGVGEVVDGVWGGGGAGEVGVFGLLGFLLLLGLCILFFEGFFFLESVGYGVGGHAGVVGLGLGTEGVEGRESKSARGCSLGSRWVRGGNLSLSCWSWG